MPIFGPSYLPCCFLQAGEMRFRARTGCAAVVHGLGWLGFGDRCSKAITLALVVDDHGSAILQRVFNALVVEAGGRRGSTSRRLICEVLRVTFK